MSEGSRPQHRRERARGHETHAERRRHHEDPVGLPVRRDRRARSGDRARVEQSPAVDLADAGGVDAGQRRRRADAVGGRDLCGVHRSGVPDGIAEGNGRVQREGPPEKGLGAEHLAGQRGDARVGQQRREHQRRHPMLEVLGQADEGLGADRPGHLVGHEGTEAAPLRIGPVDELAGQPAEGQRVVPMGRAGLPQRRLLRDSCRHVVPVQDLLQADGAVDRRQPGLVREELGHGHLLLARGGELRPVLGHDAVVVQPSPLHADRRRHGREPLRGGEHQLQRVVAVGPGAGLVEPAAHQVDHGDTAVVHRHRRADVAVGPEVGPEGIGDRFPPRRDRPAHGRLRAGQASATSSRSCSTVPTGSGPTGFTLSTVTPASLNAPMRSFT